MNRKKSYFVLVFVFAILLFLLVWNNYGIWFDELFTLNLIKNSYLTSIQITAADVHPPLYYLLVKSFVELLSFFGISTVVAAKLFSIIPIIILMVLSYPVVTKRYGIKVALIFIVSLFGTRIIMYAIEIRMYSLAILFVTLAYLYANEIRYNNSRRNWTLFVLYSILGAYTHYYAVIALSLVYIYLFFYQIQIRDLKKWFIYFGITVLAYVPWLLVLINQLSRVSEGWSFGFNFMEVAMIVIFPFFTNEIISTVLIAMFSILVFIAFSLKKNKDNDDKFALLCLLNPLYVLVVGIAIGIITQKFFSGKYLLPGWGIFWFGIALAISKSKQWKLYFSIILALNVFTYGVSFVKEEGDREGYYILKEFIKNNNDQTIYITNTLYDLLGYYEDSNNLIEVEDFSHLDKGLVIYYENYTTCNDCEINSEVLFGGATVIIGELK